MGRIFENKNEVIIIKNINNMKKLVIFSLAMLAIGFTTKAQTTVSKLSIGDVRIVTNDAVIQMSPFEYIAFEGFVKNIVEDHKHYTRMSVQTTITLQDINPNADPYVDFVYDEYSGFLVGDSNYMYVDPSELYEAMIAFDNDDNNSEEIVPTK